MEFDLEVLAGAKPPPRPTVRPKRKTPGTYDYVETSRYPVTPLVRKDLLYEEQVEMDKNYEKPHLAAKEKMEVYSWIRYFVGVRSPEREQEAWKSVKKLVELGEQAVLGVCKAADGNDPHVTQWCLKVMEGYWDARYQPILLNLLDRRALHPPELGDAVFALLLKRADASSLSWILRMLLEERQPVYVRDLCKLIYKQQTSQVWVEVLTAAGVPPENSAIGADSLMDLREPGCAERLGQYFSKGVTNSAAADLDDVFIGRAPEGEGTAGADRRIAAILFAYVSKPAQKAATDALVKDRDENCALYGQVARSRLRDYAALGKLITALGSAQWNIRHDAIEALKDLTGTDLGFDFANDYKARLAGISRWKAFEALKAANVEAECPQTEGWHKLPLRFVTEPKVVIMDQARIFGEVSSTSEGSLLSPGIVEGRNGIIRLSSGYGSLPLSLANGCSMEFRMDVKLRDRCEFALVQPGQAADFKDLAMAGFGTKPYSLALQHPDEQPVQVAYSFGLLDTFSRTVPFLRSGYMEGAFNGLVIRIMDDNNNGDFNDYGADAQFLGKARYGTLLSSVVQIGEKFYDFRVARSGACCWLRPYKGALGALRLRLPDKADFKPVAIQVQCGSMCFDATDAFKAPKALPLGQYEIAHAALTGTAGSVAIVTQGEGGGISLNASAVQDYTPFTKLQLMLEHSVDLECDDCTLRDRYKVPPGGRVLKVEVPYVSDGGVQSYIGLSQMPHQFVTEITDPAGKKVASERWIGAQGSATTLPGYKAFYRVFTRDQIQPGDYRITVSSKVAPFGNLSGDATFKLTEGK